MPRRRSVLARVTFQHVVEPLEFLAGYVEVLQEVDKRDQESR
jgi:hypothetical protein